jgi:esterase/lipase superfamily enzyme
MMKQRFRTEHVSSHHSRILVFSTLFVSLLSIGITGCTKTYYLPATPNLYTQTGENPYADLSEDLQTPSVKLLYATDRTKVQTEDGSLAYGTGRSPATSFGHCIVEMGKDSTWGDIETASVNLGGGKKFPFEITETYESFQYPDTSGAVDLIDGQVSFTQEYLTNKANAEKLLEQALSEQLAKASRKEVFVFIHGINNSFESSVFRMAQLWHMMGRVGVPFVYSWPSNPNLGPLRGYSHDRESGEFTIYHLRTFLKIIASNPNVEKMHIIAHSRGTDVALTAIRELHLQYSARGERTREELKLGNLILVAPDLDIEVTRQRVNPDLVYLAPSRFTIYKSDTDEAIGFSQWLFASIARVGEISGSSLSNKAQQNLRKGIIDVVDVKVKNTGDFGHTYFIDNPAVLSDIIMLLRDNKGPGIENGRPLIQDESGFHELYDGYPYKLKHDPKHFVDPVSPEDEVDPDAR